MKICGDCENFHYCWCGKHGWCEIERDFYNSADEAEECECYDGPSDEEDTTMRDNPRDPIIERS